MSTFTDWNGPSGGGDFNRILKLKIDELFSDIAKLDSQLGNTSSAPNGTYPGLTAAIESLKVKNLEIVTSIKTPAITTTGITSTGDINAINNAGNFKNLAVGTTTTLNNTTVNGTFKAGNVDVKKIDAGEVLDFTKPIRSTITCGHYYIIGRLSNKHDTTLFPTLNGTSPKPGTVFVYTKQPDSKEISALINMTTKDLSVLYTRSTNITNLCFGLYKPTGNYTYIVLTAVNAPPGGGVADSLAGLEIYASGINVEFTWTGSISLSANDIVAEVTCDNTHGFGVSALDTTNGTFDTLNVTAATINNLTAPTISSTTINTANITATGTARLTNVNSNAYRDDAGHMVLFTDEANTTIRLGNRTAGQQHILELIGQAARVKYNDKEVAFLTDIQGSLQWVNHARFYAETVGGLPTGSFVINSAGDTATVDLNDLALIIPSTASTTFDARPYKWSGSTWVQQPSYGLNMGLGLAFEWAVDYAYEDMPSGPYWREAEIIWHPATPSPVDSTTVAIINLPLENYYDVQQIDILLDKIRWYFGIPIVDTSKTPEQFGMHSIYTLYKTSVAFATTYTALENNIKELNTAFITATQYPNLAAIQYDFPTAAAGKLCDNLGTGKEASTNGSVWADTVYAIGTTPKYFIVGEPDKLYYTTAVDGTIPAYSAWTWEPNALVNTGKIVEVVPNYAALPLIGDKTKLYVTSDTSDTYSYGSYPIIQANWLEDDQGGVGGRFIDSEGNAVPNPSFIQNKPITTMSVLDGGNWSATSTPAWHYVVDGGDFIEIPESISNTLTNPDAYNTYPEVIFRVLRGPYDSMPPASRNTMWSLKYCISNPGAPRSTDNTLWIDSGSTSTPGSVNGNLLLSSPSAVQWMRLVATAANPTAASYINLKWYEIRNGLSTQYTIGLSVAGFQFDGTTPRLTLSGTTTNDPNRENNILSNVRLSINLNDVSDRLNKSVLTGISVRTDSGGPRSLVYTYRNLLAVPSTADSSNNISGANFNNTFFDVPNYASMTNMGRTTLASSANSVVKTSPSGKWGFVVFVPVDGAVNSILGSSGFIPVRPGTQFTVTGPGTCDIFFYDVMATI